MKHDLVVFDFFGVVCSEVAPFWLREHLSESEAVTIKESLVSAADRAQISQVELFRELSLLSGVPPGAIEADWVRRAMIDYEMVAFVEAIRQTCRVALLTNAPGPFFRNLLSDYSLADLFDPIVVSSEIGHAKPEPEIYLALLEQAGVQAAQSILLDDNPANVEGALRCGMDAILFSSLDQVRKMIGQQ